jgi:hypothetical protein
MKLPYPIHDLPGADIIRPGLEDYAAGRLSVGSLLVRIAWPRFRFHGLAGNLPDPAPLGRDAEHVLYETLCRQHGRDAYPEYRALIRLLVSFNNAADHRCRNREVQTV